MHPDNAIESSSGPPSVLVADRDATLMVAFSEYCKRQGWQVACAADGRGVLAASSRQNFDVIITDIDFPDLPGIPLLKELHQANPSQAVIVVTANGTPTNGPDLLRAGAIDLYSRTDKIDVLAHSIMRVVSFVRRRDAENKLYRHLTSESSHWEFTSREFQEVPVSLKITDRLWRAGTIDTQTKLRLDLAFQEAISNAFEHGNLELKSSWREEIDASGADRFAQVKAARLQDPKYADRSLTLTTDYQNHVLTISIKDGGPGFVPVQKKQDSNELLCSGRGMAIMTGSMDEVRYSESGTRITMIKKFKPSQHPAQCHEVKRR